AVEDAADVVIDFVAKDADELDVQREVVIGGIELEAGLQGGPGCADELAVVVVDLAVAVLIDIFDVAGFGVGLDHLARLVHVAVDLALAFEDAGGFDHIPGADGMADFRADEVRGLEVVYFVTLCVGTLAAHRDHFVVDRGEVAFEIPFKRLFFAVIGHAELDAFVFDGGGVYDGVLSGLLDYAEIHRLGQLYEDAGGAASVEIGGDGDAVMEDIGIEADVAFSAGLPMDVGVIQGCLVLSHYRRLVDAIDGSWRVVEHREIGEGAEGIEAAADTELAVGAADLEVVDPGDVEPYFFTDAPGCG